MFLRAGRWTPMSGGGGPEQTRSSDVKGREREGRNGRDDGQVRWVRSRDDCLRDCLDEGTHVPLAIWAGGVHVGPERWRTVFWCRLSLLALQQLGQFGLPQ